jgi:putative membrane protein
VAGYFVQGFEISNDLKSFLTVAAVFTVLNLFLRPVLKLILSPVLILTLGLGIILVNALVLYVLDFLLVEISINGLLPLFYGTLIISVLNILISFSAKNLKD